MFFFNILSYFPFLSTFSKFNWSDQKINFSNHVFQLKERLVTSSRHFLFFLVFSIKKKSSCKGKNQVNLSMLSFRLFYFQKSLTCINCLSLLPKTKKGIRLVFSVDFLYTFSIKMFLRKYSIK